MTDRKIVCALLTLVPLVTGLGSADAAEAKVEITPDVVYGHKDGLAMTFDVFRPREGANGAGVLFMVSGGWYSGWTPPEQFQHAAAPLTSKGFTVFAVRHGSSPRYGIADAVADVRRSVRFIRLNAERFGVDPQRLGVYGMSAGGHLSLMLGTTADNGQADAKDPVDRVSDRVQAVVAYVAPTDLTIMAKDATGRLPAYDRFPALELNQAAARPLSPLLAVTPDDAPTLLLAGAKDDLVPIAHSRRIRDAFAAGKIEHELIEYPNAGHGFQGEDRDASVREMVRWFEKYLAAK